LTNQRNINSLKTRKELKNYSNSKTDLRKKSIMIRTNKTTRQYPQLGRKKVVWLGKGDWTTEKRKETEKTKMGEEGK